MPTKKVKRFGEKESPMKRPAQPAELVPLYVLLASENNSRYISGAYLFKKRSKKLNKKYIEPLYMQEPNPLGSPSIGF
jgi:hypothetical protein